MVVYAKTGRALRALAAARGQNDGRERRNSASQCARGQTARFGAEIQVETLENSAVLHIPESLRGESPIAPVFRLNAEDA